MALQARAGNVEGAGEIRIRDLVRNALRMRPTRIVVGEVRGAEALDMLLAMNTGHEGSLTTIHGNSPRDALDRLATLAMMAEERLSGDALTKMVARTIELVVQLRFEPRTGRRRGRASSRSPASRATSSPATSSGRSTRPRPPGLDRHPAALPGEDCARAASAMPRRRVGPPAVRRPRLPACDRRQVASRPPACNRHVARHRSRDRRRSEPPMIPLFLSHHVGSGVYLVYDGSPTAAAVAEPRSLARSRSSWSEPACTA